GMINQISKTIFKNLSIVCVNLGMIKPVWKVPFNKSFPSKFNGIGKHKMVHMMSNTNINYNYYENDCNQILEINCRDGLMSMGIILPKELEFEQPKLDFSELTSLIKNMKSTRINKICIPIFTQQIKIRLSNIMNQIN
ncbi:unnamed protein product, partial [marine sediment metagenome]